MRTVIAVLLVAGLAVLGVPRLGGVASLGAQQGATVSGEGFAPNSQVELVDANNNVIATATADANGKITFTNVPEGDLTLVGEDSGGNRVATTGASRLAALLLGRILPVYSLVAPCQAGAALRKICSRTSDSRHRPRNGGTRRAVGARLSRSAIFSAALKEYVARYAPDEVTEAMNRVCDEVGDRPESFVAAASRRVLENTEW